MTTTTLLFLIAFIVGIIVIGKFVLENTAKILLVILLCLICFCAWHIFIAKDGKTPETVGTEIVGKAGDVFDTATNKIEFFVDTKKETVENTIIK